MSCFTLILEYFQSRQWDVPSPFLQEISNLHYVKMSQRKVGIWNPITRKSQNYICWQNQKCVLLLTFICLAFVPYVQLKDCQQLVTALFYRYRVLTLVNSSQREREYSNIEGILLLHLDQTQDNIVEKQSK